MEVRTLARSLRSRPVSSLLFNQQAGPASMYRQIGVFSSNQSRILSAQGIRYASTENSPAAETKTTSSAKSSDSSLDELNRVLSKLDISSHKSAQTSKPLVRKVDPSYNRRSYKDPLALSRAVSESAAADAYRTPVRRVELKLGPELGRQVHVDPDRGVDLAAALRTLQVSCAVNRVRGQSHIQKFHVRRGQRAKDLRRERWRKLFKFSFQKTVEKIHKMRAQGW